jgi:hypothetical protein
MAHRHLAVSPQGADLAFQLAQPVIIPARHNVSIDTRQRPLVVYLVAAALGLAVTDGPFALDAARRRTVAFGVSPPYVLACEPPGRRRAPIEFARGRLPVNMFRRRRRTDAALCLAHRRATQRLWLGGGRQRVAWLRNALRSLRRLIEWVWRRVVVTLSDRSADDCSVGSLHTNVLRCDGPYRTGQENQ